MIPITCEKSDTYYRKHCRETEKGKRPSPLKFSDIWGKTKTLSKTNFTYSVENKSKFCSVASFLWIHEYIICLYRICTELQNLLQQKADLYRNVQNYWPVHPGSVSRHLHSNQINGDFLLVNSECCLKFFIYFFRWFKICCCKSYSEYSIPVYLFFYIQTAQATRKCMWH